VQIWTAAAVRCAASPGSHARCWAALLSRTSTSSKRASAGPSKIGHSKDPFRRRRRLQTGSAKPLAILGYLPGDRESEQAYHLQFKDHRIGREWFRPAPELLKLAETATYYCDRHELPRSAWA